MFLDPRLDEDRALFRVEADTKPIDYHVQGITSDLFRTGVIAGQRMPVRYKIEALVIPAVLKFNPVFQGPMQISQV